MASLDDILKLPPKDGPGGGKVISLDELAKLPPKATAKAAPEPEAAPAPPSSGGPFGGGALEAGARGFVDAATFGTGDELGAMIEGVHGYLKGDGYGKAYDEALARRRKGNEAFAAAYPKTTLASGIGAGVVEAPFLPGMGAAKAGAAASKILGEGVLSRLAGAVTQGAVGGAVGGAAYGAGSAEGGLLDRAGGAFTGGWQGAGTGAALGAAAHGIGAGARGLGFGRAAEAPVIPTIADASGKLTPEATQAISRHGMTPESVSPPIARQAATELAGTRSSPTDVAATLRTLIARKHGVDLPAPQARQDIAGVARLQAAQAGTLGEPAQRTAEDAGMILREQFEKAAGDVARKAAPGAKAGYGEGGTGGLVAEGVNKKAEAEWQQVGQRYAATGTDQHVIPDAATQTLLPRIAGRIDAMKMGKVIPENAPGYTTALGMLRHYVAGGTDVGPIKAEIAKAQQEIAASPPWAVDEAAHARLSSLQTQLRDAQTVNPSLARLDDVRKTIGEMARDPRTSDTDRRMIHGLMHEYDSWIDDAVAAKAGTLPAASLAALQDARKAAKGWFAKYQRDPRNPGDVAGKLVEQVRAGNLDDQSLFNKLMGSATGFDEGGVRAARKVRDIVGEQSPEWQTVKQGMFRRIVFGDANKQSIDLQPGEQAWKTMDSRISKAIEGTGAKLAAEMLGPEVAAGLTELREVARAAAVKAKAGNPSGSGYTIERAKMARLITAMQGGIPALGGAVGLGAGALVGGLPGSAIGGIAGAATGTWLGNAAKGALSKYNAQEIAALLGPHRAPALRPAGLPALPTVPIGAAGVAGGAAFDRWRREHR